MSIRSKTLIVFLLVAVAGSVLIVTTERGSLFKGQIMNQGDVKTESDETALPDLKADLKIILPGNEGEDISVEAVIENTGEGSVPGGQPFEYILSINDIEVFSNSDSYSALDPGDSFSFVYPIPKTIYQYPDQGTVKLLVDSENSIKESNEKNNEIEQEYNL